MRPKRIITENDLRVYDLKKEGKSIVEIIKGVWPKEYEKECGTSDSQRDNLYEELCRKYREQGKEDWEDKAYYEAYREGSGRIKLFMRVNDSLKRMKKLLTYYG